MKFKILPKIRTDQPDKEGLCAISIYVYISGVLKSKIALGHKVAPAFWDAGNRRVNAKWKNATLINSLISKKVEELNTKLLTEEVINDGATVDLSNVMNREKIRNKCFFEFAEEQITKKDYAEDTRRRYRVYLANIESFKSRLKVSEINYPFLLSYEAHLRDVVKNGHNTIWGAFKFINTIVKDAIKSKLLSEDPFKVYKRPTYKQTARTFLTAEEVSKVESFRRTCVDDNFLQVTNYFLFMAYTGLRFSDASRFNFKEHVVNNERIVIQTQKTKQVANLFMNDKIRDLADYIDANPLTISAQDFNRKLKLIAIGSGIKKKVSSHVARHSFGSLLASSGIPEKVAQGLLAHGSAASTKIYFHLQNNALDEAMKKLA